MDSALLRAALLSIPLVILIGGLVLFMIFYRKPKADKEDYSRRITSFESLYKQGKLSKEEFNQIRMTLMRRQGIDLPQELMKANTSPRPVRTSMTEDSSQKKEPETKDEKSSESNNS